MSSTMAGVLVINPNTSASITALLERHVRQALGEPGGSALPVHAVTARFGVPYIASESDYVIGAHAALDAWQAWQGDEAAARAAPIGTVVIGCFGDPGLFALRDVCPVPVTGLAEASFIEASRHGRYAIVTGGARWRPMLERLAIALGHADALAGIHTVAPTGAELAADPEAALALLTRACQDAARTTRAHALILGGAGLAGYAARIQPHLDIPLVDSVTAAARHAQQLLSDPNPSFPG